MNDEKRIKQSSDFDEYLKEQLKLGEVGSEEVEEFKQIFQEVVKNGGDWREYTTYKRLDVHPDPIAAKNGRPI